MWYQRQYDELLPYFFRMYIQRTTESKGRQVLARSSKLLVIVGSVEAGTVGVWC
jgi:hypothetical protein